MRYVLTFVGLMFLIAAMTAFYWYAQVAHGIASSHIFFRTTAPLAPSEPTGRNLIVAIVAMLAGIVFGAVYARMASAQETQNAWRLIPTALVSPQLVKSLIASPVVFAAVYSAAQSQPDLVVGALFAFQNGFFCDTILRKRESA
jgi:hypothetical protein